MRVMRPDVTNMTQPEFVRPLALHSPLVARGSDPSPPAHQLVGGLDTRHARLGSRNAPIARSQCRMARMICSALDPPSRHAMLSARSSRHGSITTTCPVVDPQRQRSPGARPPPRSMPARTSTHELQDNGMYVHTCERIVMCGGRARDYRSKPYYQTTRIRLDRDRKTPLATSSPAAQRETMRRSAGQVTKLSSTTRLARHRRRGGRRLWPHQPDHSQHGRSGARWRPSARAPPRAREAGDNF